MKVTAALTERIRDLFDQIIPLAKVASNVTIAGARLIGLLTLAAFFCRLSGPAASAQLLAGPHLTFHSGTTGACQVRPRPAGDFAQLSSEPGFLIAQLQGTVVATPFPPSGGAPASAEIVDAISVTFAEYLACINAGDLPRATALLTDDYFVWLFGGADEQSLVQALASPTPLADGIGPLTYTISDVRVLTDGRVSAVTEVDGIPAFTIFSQVGGRYLIDYSYELPQASTPTP